MFAQAIDALVAERDRVFIERIALDYNLPLEELKAKYMATAAEAIKMPRQYKKRDPTAVTVIKVTEKVTEKVPKAKAEKQCCTSQTSKKEPCKFSALKGEVFCKRHLKQSLGGGDADASAKPAKKAAKKGAQPVHTHALTDAPDGDCELCQSHGNPLEQNERHFEVVAARETPVVAPPAAETDMSVETRLAAMLSGAAEADESEPDEDEIEADEAEDASVASDSVGEEEFEDDD